MTIGLVIGCYSSIAVGTPLYAIWKTHEEKYAKLEKRFGDHIGYFEFERAGASIAGNLGNSKAARRKTAQVKAANAQAAIQAEMQDSEDVIVIIEDEPAEEQGSNALGDDGKPIYQQQPRNPKKGKKKRK